MSTAVAVVLFVGVTAYAVFGGADFGAGFWDLIAGGTERGERPREVIDHSIGPVWEANHVWLIFCFVVLWTVLPGGLRLDHAHAVRPAHLAALRHRAARLELRLPQGGAPHPRPPPLRRRVRRSRRCSCRTAWAPWPARSRRGGCRPAARPATRGRAGSTRRRSSAACSPSCVVAYLAAVYLVWDARRLADDGMVEYFRRRAVAAAVVAGVVALVGHLRAARRRARTSSTG